MSRIAGPQVHVGERVYIVGGNGTMSVDVEITFDVPPAAFSPGMTMIVTEEIKRCVQRLVEQAKKEEMK